MFKKKLFTARELAAITGYSVPQIHNQIACGNIRVAFRSKRIVLIDKREFSRVVDECMSHGKYQTFKRIKKLRGK